tara:strand:+ start:1529 stop:2077 length:549 start_codon:yes stop_codon:yes gene_type:complete
MKLIGITGLARAGKDSFYNFSKPILESNQEEHNRYAFADALKEESDELLSKYVGISAFTEKTSEKEIIRPFLVTYGTHVRRKLNKNCWIEKIHDRVKSEIENGSWVFITDVRYENEIDWIHDLGGKAIHIHREGNVAPNPEELENDPILRAKADHHVSWKDFQDEDMNKINDTVNQILQSIS